MVELQASDEFARWFEWLAAADPRVAQELAGAVDVYEMVVEPADRPVFDVCHSASKQLAFVAVHGVGAVFLAAGAEVEGSQRRAMTLVSRARKVVRRFRQGRLELQPWAEVRKWGRAGGGAVNVGVTG